MYDGLQEIECEGKELSEVLMELNALAIMSSKTSPPSESESESEEE